MPRFLTIGFILFFSIAANAQRAYNTNPQIDTTLMPPAIWQDGKLIPAPPRQYIEEFGENDPPMSCLVYPDSNFIRRGFGYPTSPWFQAGEVETLEVSTNFIINYPMTNIRRYFAEGQINFLTHVTYNRIPILTDNIDLFWNAYQYSCGKNGVDLIAWVCPSGWKWNTTS